jgi:glycosyltransferase involved in cell wall biosynthesis
MMSGQAAGRPRVLFLSGLQIHPPLSGGNLRSYALGGALARQGLDVFVYSLVGRKPDYLARRPSSVQAWPDGTPEYVDRGPLGFLAQFGSYKLGLPPLWLTAYLRAAAASPAEVLLPALLREKLMWCDVTVADFPFVHPIFSAPSGRGSLRVLSTHNIEHRMCDGGSRWLRAAVRTVELGAAAACDVLVSCCESDGRFLERHATVRRSIVVPNGVDLGRFHGLESGRGPTRRALGLADDVKVFLFTGSKYGPNREAFDYLLDFAERHAGLLVEEGIHILVVGSVTTPVRRPGLTATGKVDVVEPYFAAADAALNPLSSGAGTNVKMGEFLAMRLPIVTTAFGARGFDLADGETAFLFERDGLAPVLSRVRRLLDEDRGRLRRMANDAYTRNETAVDMDACARRLVEAMGGARRASRTVGSADVPGPCPPERVPEA